MALLPNSREGKEREKSGEEIKLNKEIVKRHRIAPQLHYSKFHCIEGQKNLPRSF